MHDSFGGNKLITPGSFFFGFTFFVLGTFKTNFCVFFLQEKSEVCTDYLG